MVLIFYLTLPCFLVVPMSQLAIWLMARTFMVGTLQIWQTSSSFSLSDSTLQLSFCSQTVGSQCWLFRSASRVQQLTLVRGIAQLCLDSSSSLRIWSGLAASRGAYSWYSSLETMSRLSGQCLFACSIVCFTLSICSAFLLNYRSTPLGPFIACFLLTSGTGTSSGSIVLTLISSPPYPMSFPRISLSFTLLPLAMQALGLLPCTPSSWAQCQGMCVLWWAASSRWCTQQLHYMHLIRSLEMMLTGATVRGSVRVIVVDIFYLQEYSNEHSNNRCQKSGMQFQYYFDRIFVLYRNNRVNLHFPKLKDFKLVFQMGFVFEYFSANRSDTFVGSGRGRAIIMKYLHISQLYLNYCQPMPPKLQDFKSIVRAFEPSKFWTYCSCGPEAAERARNFLAEFEKQLIALIRQDLSFEQNFEVLCRQIGIAVHPELQLKTQEESKFPRLRNTEYGVKVVQVINFKIDGITLMLLSFMLQHYRVDAVKLSRNQLEQESEHLRKLFPKQSPISSLIFEWNRLEVPNRRDVFLSMVSPSLRHLILRQNKLGNSLAHDLLKKLRLTADLRLKTLDLSGNELTSQIVPALCEYLEQEKSIQFLGLAKNRLMDNEHLRRLFNAIGQIPVTEAEFLKYRDLTRIKEQIIERNNPKQIREGGAGEKAPESLDFVQNERGRFIVKNKSLANINLDKNGIGDNCVTTIKDFAEGNGKNIEVFLECNNFSVRSKNMLEVYPNILL